MSAYRSLNDPMRVTQTPAPAPHALDRRFPRDAYLSTEPNFAHPELSQNPEAGHL
jgi:hypothetical protein